MTQPTRDIAIGSVAWLLGLALLFWLTQSGNDLRRQPDPVRTVRGILDSIQPPIPAPLVDTRAADVQQLGSRLGRVAAIPTLSARAS